MINEFKISIDKLYKTISIKKDLLNYSNETYDDFFDYILVLIRNRLINILNSNYEGQITIDDLNNILMELIYKNLIFDEENDEYIKIIFLINELSNNKYLPTFSSLTWKKIVILSKNYLYLSKDINLNEVLKKNYPKEFIRSDCIKFLLDKGYSIEIEGHNIKFKDSLEKVCLDLENLVQRVGGLTLLKSLFSILIFSPKLSRFLFIQDLKKNSLYVPFGFLFSLSLKYPNSNNSYKCSSLIDEIIILSVIIVDLYHDIMFDNLFKHWFVENKHILDYLKKIMLQDSILYIPQSNFDLEIELCDSLFREYDEKFREELNFSFDDFLYLSKYLNENFNPNSINILSIDNHSEINNAQCINVLNFMSHLSQVNSEYLLPDDYFKYKYFTKPFIKSGSQYILMPTSVYSQNYYESFADFLDNYDEIGDKLEDFVEYLFKKNNITYKRNCEYEYNGIEGECDFIIECDDSIILIELKKKGLTRRAKSGEEYSIIIDLYQGFLISQIQACRTEMLLKKYGNIKFKNSLYIDWNNRKIKRVSLTRFEYGSFNNKFVFKNFLNSFIYGEYSFSDVHRKYEKNIEDFKEDSQNWDKYYGELKEFYDNSERFLSNSYFLSLSKLFIILNESTDNNSFDILLNHENIHYSTLDSFYGYSECINEEIRDLINDNSARQKFIS